MMNLMNVDAPGLTAVFLGLIAALTTALVGLFCTLEQSERLARLRVSLVRSVDRPVRGN
ncbi:MAG: hypothetical protein JWQ82_900 [Tardiphaga sp.]|nr:hypothetical protein [Tardiphaga sp.]MDB5521303.1 hypothetical protein [Tardiphaga sp.]